MKNITVKLVCIIASILFLGFCCFALIYWLPKDNNSAKFEIDTTEVKKSYMQGEEFSSQGLKAFIDEKELSLNLVQIDSSKFDSSKSGQYQISITYEGQVKQYSVHVYSEQEILDAFNSCPSQVGDQLQLNLFIDGEETVKQIFDGETAYGLTKDYNGIEIMGAPGQTWYKKGIHYSQKEGSEQVVKQEIPIETLFPYYDKDGQSSLASSYIANMISIYKSDSMQAGLEGDSFKITTSLNGEEIVIYLQDGKLTKIVGQVKAGENSYPLVMEISYTIEQIPALPDEIIAQI